MMDTELSKSMYTTGLKCPKALWLRKNRYELFDDSVMDRILLDNGNVVGDLAMGLFGDYTEVKFRREALGDMVRETEDLLSKGTRVICEASFSLNGLFCSADILVREGDSFEIYEVKAGTSVKEINTHDVAYQTYVLRGCGLNVTRMCLVHINSQYVRQGELDLRGLFTIEDITDTVEALLPDVPGNIAAMREMIVRPEPPLCALSEECESGAGCGFKGFCMAELPEKNVFEVSGMSTKRKLELYGRGIVGFADLLSEAKLTSAQRMQLEEKAHIDAPSVRAFLGTLWYPLYFLDFETISPAVPMFDGTRPYASRVPFQYSLHALDTADGELRHTEFLGEPETDPRRALAEKLCADIPEGACVLAYNMSFEKSVIRELAAMFADLAPKLTAIHDNIRDLMDPFRAKAYYLPSMRGSYSIKAVLPAMYPDDPAMDYHNLEGVHGGGEASDAFVRMARLDARERTALRKSLLAYCGLDTLAMVRVWQKLREV